MKKSLIAVLAVLVLAAAAFAASTYKQLFYKKLVKNDTFISAPIPLADVDSVHVLFKTSDVSKVRLQVAYNATPNSTPSFSSIDSVGYAAGIKVRSLGFNNQYSGYHSVQLKFIVDSVKTAGSTVEAYVTTEQ